MATLDKEMAEEREDKIKQNLPGGPGEARNPTEGTQLKSHIVDGLKNSYWINIPPDSDSLESSSVFSLQSIGSRGSLENVNQAKRSPPSSKLHSPKTSTANPPSGLVAPSSGLPPPSAAMSAPKATAASATSLSGATADMKQSPFGLKSERKFSGPSISADEFIELQNKDKTIKDLQRKVIEKDKTILDLEGEVDTLKAKRQEDKYKMKQLEKTTRMQLEQLKTLQQENEQLKHKEEELTQEIPKNEISEGGMEVEKELQNDNTTLESVQEESQEGKIKQNLPGGPGEARKPTEGTQLKSCTVDGLKNSYWRNIPPDSDSLESSSVFSSQQSIASYSAAAQQTNPFVSRYLADFEPVLRLGKGGCGEVFQAEHKFDVVQYAIKRIRLPNCDEAREGYLQEAKVLAKLKHPSIVQYNTTWFEAHTVGWLKDNRAAYFLEDSDLEEDTSGSSADTSSTTSGSSADTSSSNASEDSDGGIEFGDTNEGSENGAASGRNISSSKSSNESTSGQALVFGKYHKCKSEKCTPDTPLYLFIQMELCDGNTLEDWLKTNTQRNHLECLHIFEQIVGAVIYFHGKGVIHGDLKPANIFFSSLDGSVKVGDFGLVSGSVQEPADNTTKGKSDANHAGQVGSYLSMSPDKIEGRAADVFSLGVIFELFQSFSTEMERIKAKLVEWIKADSPKSRPTAAEICDSDIYKKIRNLADIA